MIRPLESRYKGYRFRSRLEARWAVYLDALSLKWEYEREGFDLGNGVRYLPDFWLPDVSHWAEVKPIAPSTDELDKITRLVDESDCPCVILVGPPDLRVYQCIRPAFVTGGCGLCGRTDCPKPNPGSRADAQCPVDDEPSLATGPFVDHVVVGREYARNGSSPLFGRVVGLDARIYGIEAAADYPGIVAAVNASRAARFDGR